MKLTKLILALTLALPVFAATYTKDVPSKGVQSALVGALGQPEYKNEALDLGTRFAQIKLASADVKLLNSRPILIVTSPGAGKALIPIAAYATIDYNTGTYVTNSNETLDVEYGGGGSGDVGVAIPVVLMEATADAIASEPAISVVPVENAGLYAHIGGGDPTGGDSDIFIRVYYKIVPSLLTK